ncbi:U32 family peptidase [Paracoccus sp. (in: a-proteobacteria)]|uniref:ubiquinone anaerobic biosynthesis protein UbiV n=1 Tax=Paracoccus sp. TaxID=267 RepID=UPI003220428E
MDLTIGPNAFFWSAEAVRGFYAGLAQAPVARVVIGEWVCSKRLPFWQHEIPAAVEALTAAGKDVAITTLALITLKRERRQTAELLDMGLPVEVNDLSALNLVPADTPFWVGPMVNVYNEGTLEWLAGRGATRVCLPPELPLESIATLAAAGRAAGVAVEVWGHGRAPLAISGRCYHARLHDRAKDSCQFVCGEDPDGRDVDTLDGQPFLTVNGVQTLGRAVTTAAGQVADLRAAGVDALRLSPHVGDFTGVARAWAAELERAAPTGGLLAELARLMPGASFCDGFVAGKPGAAMARPA